MTKTEALQLLAEGKRMTHVHFTSDEWIETCGCNYIFEDGVICDPEEFWHWRQEPSWNDGWSVVNK